MTPAILPLASLAWLTALCCGFPAPVTGPSAKNGFLRITMPGVAYYGDPVVRTAVYAQERAELVIKWLATLLAGNIAAWLTSGSWQAAAMFLAFGALAYGLQRSRPIIRLREYVGHAVEVLWVERHSGNPGYRGQEIERMIEGYNGLFIVRNVAPGLRRAEPIALAMLVLIRPALTRFQKEQAMIDTPILPDPLPIHPPTMPDSSTADSGGSGQTTPPPPPKPPVPPQPDE